MTLSETARTNGIEQPAGRVGDGNLKSENPDRAREAGSVLAETAQRAGGQAKEAVSALASEAGEQLHGYMDQQLAAGADLAGHVGDAIKAAADELDRSSPMLSSVIRSAGTKVESLSQHLRNRTADEVLADTRDFVQRKPALVFGAAAALGFVAYRLLSATQASSREPGYRRDTHWRPHPTNASFRSTETGHQPGHVHVG